MINPFAPKDETLQVTIDYVYKEMTNHDAHSEEYAKCNEQLGKLYALQNKGVDPNVLLTVLGNTFIAIAVIKFEQTGVITTKVLSFLTKR